MVKVANIQHLATPVIAQLAEPLSAIELAGLLHPTPAVGGEPGPRRRGGDPRARGHGPRLVRRARSAGWTRPRTANSASPCAAPCSATARRTSSPAVGIVAGSDPAAELAETEVKLQALLPLLAE